MPMYVNRLPDLVIPINTKPSNVIDCDSVFDDAEALVIVAPGTLSETVNISVSVDGGTTYGLLSINGATAIALAAGVATEIYLAPACTQIKVVSTTNVAAARTFQFSKKHRIE